jgi:hypothetical protein
VSAKLAFGGLAVCEAACSNCTTAAIALPVPKLLGVYSYNPTLSPAAAIADAPDELKVDFHASQEAARKWKVGAAAICRLSHSFHSSCHE